MAVSVEEVCAEVLKRVTPSEAERKKIEALAKKLEKNVASAAEKLGVKARVRVEGSVAKDTWLSGDPDVDVFMRVPTAIPRMSLGDVCLKVARSATRSCKQVERFAEHPYLEAFVDGVRVNIVPCYDAKRGGWISATDRTPFHTDYVNKRFDAWMRSEVRLLKRFMKGINVYGAEIKVGGFSGYLCELLVLHYGSFLDTLKAFAQSKGRLVIDIEGFYDDRRNEVDLLFDEPLVVVDPVDKGRNVASAVREQMLWTMVAAAQAFLSKPGLKFFFPPGAVPLSAARLSQELKKRESKIVFVTFGKVGAVPDILWGQLYKSLRSLRKLIELNDFSLLRAEAWSDEAALNMFVFELEHCCISPVKRHLGPPLDKDQECEKFVAKYVDSPETVCGPYVEDGRWVVLVRRKITDACELLKGRLKDGGKNAGVAEGLSLAVKKGFKIMVNEEIADVHTKNKEFAVFLTEFLSGRPSWLGP